MEAPAETHRNVGPYVLFHETSHGGEAAVYLGRRRAGEGFDRTIAAKGIASDSEDPARLTAARRATSILHPNVVTLLDVLEDDGELLFVTDYVHGESLSHLLRGAAKKRVPIPRRVFIMLVAGVLRGLDAAHETRSPSGEPLGIVHGDLSPQTLLIGADGVARVVDFGVAAASAREAHATAYKSPEQLSGAAVDRRADVYAVGVMLWEGLTGQRLFDPRRSPDPAAVLAQKLAGAVDPPSRSVASTPKALDDIVLRALAGDPGGRYATAREMAEALEAAVPAAQPKQLADWVTQVAGDVLDERAAEIAAIESVVTAPPRTAGEPRVSPKPPQVAPPKESPRAEESAAAPGPPEPRPDAISLLPAAASLLPAATDSLPPAVVIPPNLPTPGPFRPVTPRREGAPGDATSLPPARAKVTSSGRYVLGAEAKPRASQPNIRAAWADEAEFEERPLESDRSLRSASAPGPTSDDDDDDVTKPERLHVRPVPPPALAVAAPLDERDLGPEGATPRSPSGSGYQTSGEAAASFYGEPRALGRKNPTLPPEPPVMLQPDEASGPPTTKRRPRAERDTEPPARARAPMATLPPAGQTPTRGTFSHRAIAFVLAVLAVGAIGIIALRWIGK